MTLKPVGRMTMTMFCYILLPTCGWTQDKHAKELAKITPADFSRPSFPSIDSNSSAVVLADIGEIHFTGNQDGWFSYVLQIHKRIKILNKKAFDDVATVR